MKEIVLAGGCFWGVEEYFSRIEGVTKTTVGYANGQTEAPSYEAVCTGLTNHAEVVKIVFDESILSIGTLLDAYWHIIDPTLLNRQGPDKGSQYRTGIYYTNEADLEAIKKSYSKEQLKYVKTIVTELEPLKDFYDAEEKHQAYLKKNPGGYCHIKLD